MTFQPFIAKDLVLYFGKKTLLSACSTFLPILKHVWINYLISLRLYFFNLLFISLSVVKWAVLSKNFVQCLCMYASARAHTHPLKIDFTFTYLCVQACIWLWGTYWCWEPKLGPLHDSLLTPPTSISSPFIPSLVSHLSELNFFSV